MCERALGVLVRVDIYPFRVHSPPTSPWGDTVSELCTSGGGVGGVVESLGLPAILRSVAIKEEELI